LVEESADKKKPRTLMNPVTPDWLRLQEANIKVHVLE